MTPITLRKVTVYRLKEISKRVGLGNATLRKHLAAGTLQGRKVGGVWWVSAAGLRAFEKFLVESRKS